MDALYELNVGTLEIVDKLAHTIKNLDKIIESYEEDGYSEEVDGTLEGGMYARRGRYSREGGMRGTSYARGRRGNVRRDSMGRYSRDTKMMVHELKELMEDAPDERTKMEFKKFIEKVEHM